MKFKGKSLRLIRFGILSFFLLLPFTVSAQTLLGSWNARRSALIEWYKPAFSNSDPYSFTSSALYLNLKVPATDKIAFEADFPWIYSDLRQSEFPDYSNRQTYGIGNPYLGVAFHRPMSILFLQAGLRLPLARFNSWPAQYLGEYSDISRPGSFFDRAWTFRFMGGVHYENVTGFGLRLKAGPDIVVDQNFSEGNIYFNYCGQMRFDARLFEVGGGLQGRILLNQSGAFRDRTVNEAFLEGSTSVGFLQPGMYIALPIDNHFASIVKYIIGFNVRIRLGAI